MQQLKTYSAISHVALDKFHRLGFHPDRAGAVDHALALDGLGEEGHGWGRLVG